MFELFLMIGIGAIVICFLKGHRLYAVLTLIGGGVVVVVGTVLSDQTQSFLPALAGLVLFAGAAAYGAIRAARPGSAWDRSAAAESKPERRPSSQRTSRRLLHAGIGAILGMLPALLFMFGVVIAGTIFNWSGDTMQVGFVGLPFVPLGLIVGAVVGYQWVPRKSAEESVLAAEEGTGEAPVAPRNRVFTGVAAGVLVGAFLVLVDSFVGFTGGRLVFGPLILIISGAIGGWWGSRHSAPPGAPAAR
ncbi:MAG: hypothetical protein ABFR89_11765 [Actinomycetota bacterium]